MPVDPQEHFSRNAEAYADAYAMDAMPDEYLALLDAFIERVGSGRVLDAGCGTGKDAEYFRENGLEVVGVDSAPGMIAHAQEHGDAEYHRMDIRDLAFDSRTFDGVWCNTVMQFFPPEKMPAVIAELTRTVKPDGIYYTTFKEGDSPVVTDHFGNRVKRYRVPEERARDMLTEQGLIVQEVRRGELNGLTVLNIFCEKR